MLPSRRFPFLLFVPFAAKFHDLTTRESALSNASLQDPLMTSDGRLTFAFTANGKREFVPRDLVFHLLNRLLFMLNSTEIDRFTPILFITIVLSCFYLLISHFENFQT